MNEGGEECLKGEGGEAKCSSYLMACALGRDRSSNPEVAFNASSKGKF